MFCSVKNVSKAISLISKSIERDGNSFFRSCTAIKFHNLVNSVRNFTTDSDALSKFSSNTDKWISSLDENTQKRILKLKDELLKAQELDERLCMCSADEFKPANWKYLLSLVTKTSRMRYYSYISENEAEKFATEKAKYEAVVDTIHEYETRNVYGLLNTTLLPRINGATVNRHKEAKMLQAKQFNGQKVIIDVVYDTKMDEKDVGYATVHLEHAYRTNRDNCKPFDMYLFHQETSSMIQQLGKLLPLSHPTFPLEVHQRCFSEAFPKEQLVYLTPYSDNVLSSYSVDDVYVVPGVVDWEWDGSKSLDRAAELKLRTAWFPINQYLPVKETNIGLPMKVIVQILLEFKNTRDWKKAFKSVPQRMFTGDPTKQYIT